MLTGLWRELNILGKAVLIAFSGAAFLGVAFLIYLVIPSDTISFGDSVRATASAATVGGMLSGAAGIAQGTGTTSSAEAPVMTHIVTPAAVKGVYMTACIAAEPALRARVLATIDGTEVNSLIVDLKDYTGTISYAQTQVEGPQGRGCRVADLPRFIASLHDRHLYTIARVTVFQDPLYSRYKPALAVQSLRSPGTPWKDKNGLSYIDPDSREYWDYIVAIATEAYAIGFDEINFDYIRFPSDGDMSDVQFAVPPGMTKAEIVTSFFRHLHEAFAPLRIPISGDLFGQTTVNRDDMGIGQVLENALPYFDYVAPMTYPSHFTNGFMGYDKPARYPYEIIRETMMSAVERAAAASTSPSKIRPWLQAFDLGAIYTPEMVKSQMRAVTDSGLTSWLLWDPANKYNREAL